ncbi:hypothetical protein ABBQ32_007713 [Trebouxia sp. C0010 RCD-2024]
MCQFRKLEDPDVKRETARLRKRRLPRPKASYPMLSPMFRSVNGQFLAFLAHKTLPPCKYIAERNNFARC